MTTVRLVVVDEVVLAELVAAAREDADPDDVTPRFEPGWGPERERWLRGFHLDRRDGLTGPLAEATWAVVLDGAVVGGVRLRAADDPQVLETGIWLTRSVRRRGVGTSALALVVGQAREAGARAVTADTTAPNLAMTTVLSRLGFRLEARTGDAVHARLELRPDR